jgi:hypothetical protein
MREAWLEFAVQVSPVKSSSVGAVARLEEGGRVKRLATLAAAIGVIALAVGIIVPTAAGDTRGGRTIRVVERFDELSFVDTGDTGPSLGDALVFHSNLVKDGDKVGHAGGVCTLTSLEEGATGEFQCNATYWFENGQITLQGLLQPSGEFPDRFVVPVTGGSGAYQGVGGELHELQTSETRSVLTFQLDG